MSRIIFCEEREARTSGQTTIYFTLTVRKFLRQTKVNIEKRQQLFRLFLIITISKFNKCSYLHNSNLEPKFERRNKSIASKSIIFVPWQFCTVARSNHISSESTIFSSNSKEILCNFFLSSVFKLWILDTYSKTWIPLFFWY